MGGFGENIRAATGAGRPTLLDAITAAAETMTPAERVAAWKRTGHGVTVYTQEEQLNVYLVAYGEMHRAKLEAVFSRLDASAFSQFMSKGMSIVDWGCGQGLATLAFLDWMRRRNLNIKVRAVRLLEMSDVARERAFDVLSLRMGPDSAVVSQIPWRGGEPLRFDSFTLPDGVPVLHLFSNILDVAEVDLKNVANVVEVMKTCGPSLVVTVSPKNLGSSRLGVFWQLLGTPPCLARSDDQIPLIDTVYVKNLRYCTAVGMGYALAGEPKPDLVNRISVFHVFELGGASDATFDGFREGWGNYCYSMPANEECSACLDESASPLYAVLNNMIARGRPSRASVATEERLSHELGLTDSCEEAAGAIRYAFRDPESMRVRCEEVRGAIDPFSPRPAFSADDAKFERLLLEPVLVSRIQHTVVRGLLERRIKPASGVVRTLAVEHDVPCAKAALDELSEMISHLVDFASSECSVPKVRFDVTSCRPEDIASHTGETFDIVLDVSFYRSSISSRSLSVMKGRYAFGVCIETARPDAPRTDSAIVTGDNIVYRPVAEKLPDGTYGKLPDSDHLRYFLQNIFRKRDFRPGQLPILNRALQDRSVIGLLPTGGGKSLTYQLAGMMQPGVVMIIDPLRSLMKDQYDGLVRTGITAASFVNSTQDVAEQRKAMRKVVGGGAKFLFVSPERLTMPGFRKELLAMYDNGIYYSYGVIDEVHCVSEWGHDFRFTYLHLGRNIHQYVRRKPSARFLGEGDAVVPLFGLTATASFDVLSDVERELSGPGAYELDADSVIRYENTNRLELQYRVERVEPPVDPDATETRGEYLARCVTNCEKHVSELESSVNADPSNRGLKTLLKSAKQELFFAKAKLRKHYSLAKEQSLVETIERQGECFRQLLDPASVRTMKERFLERESIDPESLVGKSVLAADLDVSLDIGEWKDRESGFTSAALVFCPYKGFKRDKGESKGPTPLSVESVRAGLAEKYSEAAVRYFTGSTDDPGHDQAIMRNQEDYIANRAAVMVATTAFGMGIDKPNIRFVIEMNHPKSIEAFVQEAGRAGRDRQMALATIYLSGQNQVDLDVVDFFHKQNFIGMEHERKRIVRLFKSTEMALEDEGGEPLGGIKGFYDKLMAAPIGGSIVVTIPYQRTVTDADGTNGDEVGFEIKEQEVYDTLVYRLCCIGLIRDVECIYTPGTSPRELRLKMVHLADGGYYGELKNFLMRYFNEKRAETELSKARAMGYSEISNCILYLEKFVYENVQRKRRLAMEDMNAFCRDGLRGATDGRDWLAVNEDLKDFIYYYFNSKYARSGYTTLDGKPYSLIDDCGSGRDFDFALVEKYMGVVDESVLDGASPKDNVKHLLGAVRLIARGVPEVNPALSILHAFCLCYLGFNRNGDLVAESIRRIGVEGVSLVLERKLVSRDEAWRRMRWLRTEFGRRTDVPKRTLDGIFAAARATIHAAKARELIALTE